MVNVMDNVKFRTENIVKSFDKVNDNFKFIFRFNYNSDDDIICKFDHLLNLNKDNGVMNTDDLLKYFKTLGYKTELSKIVVYVNYSPDGDK